MQYNQLLEDLEPQLTDDVEVVSSWQPPNDFYRERDWVRVFRNRVNTGGWTNTLIVMTQARGEYVWTLGDDERLEPNAVRDVLDATESGAALVIGWDGIYDMGAEPDSYHEDYAAFIRACGDRPTVSVHTLMSCNTIRRDLFDFAFAVEKLDTLYPLHYGMMTNIFDKPVKLTRRPTFIMGMTPSVHQRSDAEKQAHHFSYPWVVRDYEDWVSERTGERVPRWQVGDGFYRLPEA